MYYEGKNSGTSYNEYILVDGQQRVTTILILLCAIRDTVENEDVVRSINTRYLKNDTGDNRFRVRLEPVHIKIASKIIAKVKFPKYSVSSLS